jgi:DNA-binding PadR family transcriptional regulator
MHEQRTQQRRRKRRMRGRGPGRGGHGGHRARRGDVRSSILALLVEKPMHGYEMIQELEERTAGRWRPSAGSIYPTLQLLEDEGLVRAEEVDGKRVFSLTQAGGERASERADAAPPWEQGEARTARHELRDVTGQVNGGAMQVARAGDEAQIRQAIEVLAETRKRLYSILAAD